MIAERPSGEAGLPAGPAAAGGRVADPVAPADGSPPSPAPEAPADELLGELKRRQNELENQNEILRKTLIALEKTRDCYLDIYDFPPVGHATIEAAGVIADIDQSGTALLRLSREAMLGRRFDEFVLPADVGRWQEYLAAIHAGAREAIVLTLLPDSGQRLDVRLDCLYASQDGQAAVLRIAPTDLCERKLAELALRNEEMFFRTIAENVGDFVAVLDRDGRRLYNSPSYQRLFGKARELQGSDSFAEIHADDRPRVMQAFRETVETGRGRHLDYRFVLDDGSIRHMESFGGVVKDAEGRVDRVVVVSHDVTEHVEDERQLRIAATAFEAQEGMLVTDAEGVILRVNHAFTQITGYTADEAIGKTPHLLYSGYHDAPFYTRMWEAVDRKGGWQGEIWNRRKSGEVYPQWLNITAVKDRDGMLTHYVGTMTDITQRKASEDEFRLLAFYDQLTGLPNRRLLMDRLQQALITGARTGHGGALLFIDLDNFKVLNDTFGHDQGDCLLQQVARRLLASVREGDTVARMGGDEFVVVLEDLSEVLADATSQAETIGGKILAALNRDYDLSGTIHHSTPSIGVTLFRSERESAEALLKRADLAMYQAKSAGRNTMRFFDAAMQS